MPWGLDFCFTRVYGVVSVLRLGWGDMKPQQLGGVCSQAKQQHEKRDESPGARPAVGVVEGEHGGEKVCCWWQPDIELGVVVQAVMHNQRPQDVQRPKGGDGD